MANGIKQPRASIACSRNRDPQYIALASTIEGLAAIAVFDALLCAAKDQDNRGTFDAPDSVIAMLCGVPEIIFIQSKIKLIGLKWLEMYNGRLVVRSFEKWNPVGSGGARPGAGRPPMKDSKEIKPVIESNSNNLPPSPSPVPLESTALSAGADVVVEPKRFKYSDDFEAFWRHVPSEKKSGKGAAYKVWKRMTPEDRAKAEDRMEWQAGCFAAINPDRVCFLKDPQGWLSGRKFDDNDEAVKLLARGK